MGSSYVFIDSLKRDVFKYPNSADFIIDGSQTENWNLIRSSTPSLPIQRSANQFFNVKVCELILPVINNEDLNLLKEPGVFLCLELNDQNKTRYINHINALDTSAFPHDHPDVSFAPLSDIAVALGKAENDLTPLEIRDFRMCEIKKFYGKTDNQLSRAAFFMTCDKIQFDDEARPIYIHYKSCIDHIMPLSLRGNSVRFYVTDVRGKILNISDVTGPITDLWEEEHPAVQLGRQLFALLEFTYLAHIEEYNKVHPIQIFNQV